MVDHRDMRGDPSLFEGGIHRNRRHACRRTASLRRCELSQSVGRVENVASATAGRRLLRLALLAPTSVSTFTRRYRY
jgi:hypothetical protein